MIIWVNGAFGAGKTQTTHELHRRIPDSYIYDPENAGYFIRKNIPASMAKSDFQDHKMWRETNYGMIKYMHEEYDGTLIIPMTIVNPVYFDEIVGRLRRDGVVVHHFALCAAKETLLKRLRSRGENERSWAAQQIDRCIEGLSLPAFERQLQTDAMTIPEVAEAIAEAVNIELMPDNRGKLRRKYDNLITQIRHIRFFQ
ncbi:AAA family ATPase [Paenibacillus azoreducens]|uniref:Tunicamycin resistance protein n=1 Tax=Paenibacillus azoreducens TaxID=116718 RepID=A0A920CP79_9BACL|nr:AAA family ATPase [Paenibacillus azoreducens]GIO46090.1 tunicamycin resistance protein [Paenibacillus azoreducens]